MKATVLGFFFFFFILFIVPELSLAAAPLVPAPLVPCEGAGCQTCHIVQTANGLIAWLIGIMATLCAIVVVVAGFKMVMSAGNPGGLSAAKELLTNAIIGFLILLSAWLIVDTIMKLFVGDKLPGYGPWNEIQCSTSPRATPLTATDAAQSNNPEGIVTGGRPAKLATGQCEPSNLMSAAQQGGYTLTQAQANTLSCISLSESGCRNNPGQASTPGGQPTSATGVFQIVFGCSGCNDPCHNLNIPACTEVARQTGFTGTDLNCFNAFRGGLPRPGYEANAAACKAAGQNLACNTAAAACLIQAAGGKFTPWAADPRASSQKNCIAAYGG